jgi:CHAT domain-containing protein
LEPELLTIGELKVDYRTDAQLVALFGCATAAGGLLANDDFESAAYHWLKAGAASAIASLWQLDIDFLETWSHEFLTNWIQRAQPKAVALRNSLRSTLESDPHLNPYDWGVISLFGDWL